MRLLFIALSIAISLAGAELPVKDGLMLRLWLDRDARSIAGAQRAKFSQMRDPFPNPAMTNRSFDSTAKTIF
jgi:hypothetical protein